MSCHTKQSRHSNLCHDTTLATGIEPKQPHLDEQMRSRVERLGELVGRAITEWPATHPHQGR